MTTYTHKNIEDWDFRSWTSPLRAGTEPTVIRDFAQDLFLMEHFTEVIAVDHARLVILDILIRNAVGELSPNKEDVILHPGEEAVLQAMSSWRDALTSEGRFHRRIVKSLVREWNNNRKLRFTILPTNMREQFPGLYDSKDWPTSEHGRGRRASS